MVTWISVNTDSCNGLWSDDTSSGLRRLQRNDRDIIHWLYYINTEEQFILRGILEWNQLNDSAKVLRTLRIRWHDHVERSDGWLKEIQKLNLRGGPGRGRSR